MGWSIRLGQIFGIRIQVHVTFLLILLWGAFNYGGSAGPAYGLLVTLALFALVLLHELGHSLAAMRYGIPVQDITLLPIGGVARLQRMPEKPGQELVVALAGPAVNVVLAIVLLPAVLGVALLQGTPLSLGELSQPGVLGLLTFLLGANVSLAVFNMIPAFPMDGGRVLRAVLGLLLEYQRATRVAVAVGRVMAVMLGLAGLLSGQFMLAIIALFIFGASGQEGQAVAIKELLRRVRVGQTRPRSVAMVSSQATIGQAASMAMNGYRDDIGVVDPYTQQLVGVVDGDEAIRAARRGNGYRSVQDIMQPMQGLPEVTLNTTMAEVYEKLSTAPGRVAAVYDGAHFRGLIGIDDVQRVLEFLSRRGAWAASR
jgi:Zn-dependent protease